jgi:hypothetical protein
MANFFATPDDLLPVLQDVERRIRIKYTLTGHLNEPRIESFETAKDLPALFEPAPYESAIQCPTYLVTEAAATVVPRPFQLHNGKRQWVIDQLENPDSVVLSPGGLFGDNVLLCGRVATAHKTAVSARLQRAFDDSCRRHFAKIRAFRVGKQAESLLDRGYRLTAAQQSPPEYDLAR